MGLKFILLCPESKKAGMNYEYIPFNEGPGLRIGQFAKVKKSNWVSERK